LIVNGGSPDVPGGDRAPVRVTYPAMRSSSRIRCTHALMSAGREKAWGEVPEVPPGVRLYLVRVQPRPRRDQRHRTSRVLG
jgi:hypothetical protein